MVAHERHITVTESGKVTISGLPVREGQRLRVIITVEEADRQKAADDMIALFKHLQTLPQIQGITDEEIAAEIAAYRRERGSA